MYTVLYCVCVNLRCAKKVNGFETLKLNTETAVKHLAELNSPRYVTQLNLSSASMFLIVLWSQKNKLTDDSILFPITSVINTTHQLPDMRVKC